MQVGPIAAEHADRVLRSRHSKPPACRCRTACVANLGRTVGIYPERPDATARVGCSAKAFSDRMGSPGLRKCVFNQAPKAFSVLPGAWNMLWWI
jgi:hypothetical protein